MPNTENINKLIAWINADQGKHLKMAAYAIHLDDSGNAIGGHPEHYIECKTAFCLCGSANLIRLEEAGKAPKAVTRDFWHQFSDEISAGEWLGTDDYDDLFHIDHHGDGKSACDRFDKLSPDIRAETAIKVLIHLRDTGGVDWDAALPEFI